MMLVQALRLHLEGGGGGIGWMFALTDKQLSLAMNAMHEDPLKTLSDILSWERRGSCARLGRGHFPPDHE
jgi:hypothetical protein